MKRRKIIKDDLTLRLQELSEELEELKEERNFVLGQTGIHLGGNVVKNYEAEVIALTQSIEKVKMKLEKRKSLKNL